MSRKKGNQAEAKASLYLSKNGYKILETNFYAKKLGEIDIIAYKNNTYHFVEVKSANSYETAVNNITPSKLQKLIRSVEFYIQTNEVEKDYVIDAIIVTDSDIQMLENITF